MDGRRPRNDTGRGPVEDELVAKYATLSTLARAGKQASDKALVRRGYPFRGGEERGEAFFVLVALIYDGRNDRGRFADVQMARPNRTGNAMGLASSGHWGCLESRGQLQ